MTEALYQTLQQELSVVQGVTRAQLLTLPQPIRRVFNQMMRRGADKGADQSMTLAVFAQALGCDEPEAAQIATLLGERGYLYQFLDPETGAVCLQVRFGQKRGRDLPLHLKEALQTLKALQLIEVNSDLGASMGGARQGVEALKSASSTFNRKFFANYPALRIDSQQYDPELGRLTPYAKGIAAIYAVYQQISQAVYQALAQDYLPVVISGDHSTAAGTIAGIKQADPGCRLGVVWIDAHADIHSPYTTPSGNMHGMPLAAALAEDNLAMQVNTPNEITRDYWQQIKHLGGVCPKIDYADLVYVAVRDTEPAEEHLIAQHQIKNFTTAMVRQQGVPSVVQAIRQCLAHCDRLYISFDVDSMDPDLVSAGTGTPVADGLTDAEAGQLIAQLIQGGNVCCFEICEINPGLEGRSNRIGHSAFTILESAAVGMTNQ